MGILLLYLYPLNQRLYDIFNPLSFINIQVYPHEFSTEPTTPTKTQYFHPAIERQ